MFFLRIKPHYLFICSKIVAYWWGVTYNDVVPECYIITMDGLESEHFADVAPYIFEESGTRLCCRKEAIQTSKKMLSDSTSSKYIP